MKIISSGRRAYLQTEEYKQKVNLVKVEIEDEFQNKSLGKNYFVRSILLFKKWITINQKIKELASYKDLYLLKVSI